MRLLPVAATLVAASIGTATAQPVTQAEVQRAQAASLTEIGRIIDAYAAQLGMNSTFVSYCRSEMGRETSTYPSNGYTPFGTNYNTIKDQQTLDLTLRLREDWEIGYLKLCLADASNTLRAAEQR